ncbi:MAG: hypothetical protein KC731_29760 [Myxococcales bacterium]|nr:hypothetical protein [Myxococcales bacterium]
MKKLPGTSYVIAADGKATFTIDLARFGITHPIGSVDAISIVLQSLEVPVRRADLGPLRLGKIISNSHQSEAGLFIDLSYTEGAVISAVCPRITNEVKLTVARSSPALRALVWTALAVCCVGGVALAFAIFTTWDPQLRLAVGLLLGVFVAIGIIVPLSKSTTLAGGRSAEVAEKLSTLVAEWEARAPGRQKRSAKRKKKTRKKTRQGEDA